MTRARRSAHRADKHSEHVERPCASDAIAPAVPTAPEPAPAAGGPAAPTAAAAQLEQSLPKASAEVLELGGLLTDMLVLALAWLFGRLGAANRGSGSETEWLCRQLRPSSVVASPIAWASSSSAVASFGGHVCRSS